VTLICVASQKETAKGKARELLGKGTGRQIFIPHHKPVAGHQKFKKEIKNQKEVISIYKPMGFWVSE
jgi:hypothetical protein